MKRRRRRLKQQKRSSKQYCRYHLEDSSTKSKELKGIVEENDCKWPKKLVMKPGKMFFKVVSLLSRTPGEIEAECYVKTIIKDTKHR